MDDTVLLNELIVDPETRNYSGMTDVEAAANLNTEYRTEPVDSITGNQVFEATTSTDYSALTEVQLRLYHAIIGMGEIQVGGNNTKVALFAMFAGGTDTRTNLIALATRAISRAVELGLGVVRAGDVQRVRT